jgi:hypothetical protein
MAAPTDNGCNVRFAYTSGVVFDGVIVHLLYG